jgi:hypothetical protein
LQEKADAKLRAVVERFHLKENFTVGKLWLAKAKNEQWLTIMPEVAADAVFEERETIIRHPLCSYSSTMPSIELLALTSLSVNDDSVPKTHQPSVGAKQILSSTQSPLYPSMHRHNTVENHGVKKMGLK